MAIRKHRAVRTPKREVEWDGCWYKVRSNKIVIPDLKTLPRFEALTWLCRETYSRGYSRPNPLAGFAGAITVAGR
jgi:hypothetical protein